MPATPPQPTPPVLALLAPCYNEAAIIGESVRVLKDKLAQWKSAGLIDAQSFCCFVDDGSTDDTWRLLSAQADAHCRCVKLAHNVGHQNALFAGLVQIVERADCCVSIDADLQDDVDAVVDMLAHYQNGAQVVYGVRDNRQTDAWSKRFLAQTFYRLFRWFGGGVYNHADFRLLGNTALRILTRHSERNLYLRGLVYSLRLPCARVYYSRRKRIGGQAKYTIRQSLALAFNAITSHSVTPLRFIAAVGLLMATVSFVMMVRIIIAHLSGDDSLVVGWASLMVSLYFIGGLIMLSLGVIGEYIGKIYIESKRRPLYVIEDELGGASSSARGERQHQHAATHQRQSEGV